MERPLSGDSSTTAPSIASGPTHKRKASVKDGSKATGSSTVALFVTNLRLLNLDILPDSPSITVQSLSNQDARTKIKCTEYALYQLFRLYDPANTADKLQPFFPPLEPLQSVNLRAALFRCLNELKKNGVLAKDTVLRKSMLDDCSGDKFWDVCLSFSAVVLRKVTLEKKAKYGRPVAEKIGTERHVSKKERESMLPLAIAHRAALSKVLKEKQRKKDTYVRLYDLLWEKEQELTQRKLKAQDLAQKTKQLQHAKLKAVEDAIQKSWVGSTELKDALIEGDTCAQGDGILVESFDQLWRQDGDNELALSNGAEVGLLQSLSSKATQQGVRLRMWQNYLDRLVAAKPAPPTQPSTSDKSALKFNRHRDLNLKSSPSSSFSSNDTETTPPKWRTKHAITLRYDDILTAMREDLRKNSNRSTSGTHPPSAPALKRAHTSPLTVRVSSYTADASPGAQNPHSRSTSQTAVPFGPRLGRRVTSQSRSYDKPKVESQREPIPLKSELFSPLKENSNRRSHSALASPAEEGEVEAVAAVGGDDGEKRERRKVVDSVMASDAEVAGLSDGSSTNSSNRSSVEILEGRKGGVKLGEKDFKVPALPEKKALDTRLSLAERTRMSIAFNNSEDGNGFLPDQSPLNSTHSDTHDATLTSLEHSPAVLDRRSSLLNRTRESILKAPPPKKPSHTRSRSSLHPVNQFATPKKSRRSTISVRDGKRDVTPIEQLLSPDAEYDSVFKSRPRVAHSPVLSPRREREDRVVSSPLGNGDV